jgi:hypothetical protein
MSETTESMSDRALESGSTTPAVIEQYRDYSPPVRLKRSVECLLEYVPLKYIAGLKTIVLTNQNALTRKQRKQKVWQRGRKHRLALCRGAYYRATRSAPAAVWLYVDNILESQPPWTLRVPFLRYFWVGPVLYHEIGHHIHTVHRRVYEGRENVADKWKRYLMGRFLRKHYWYALPILYPMSLCIRVIRRLSAAKS